jgi:hypothetical protein
MPQDTILIATFRTEEGALIDAFTLKPKEFKTGSRGFYALGKVEINGKRYQTQIQLVEIGSRPAGPENEPVETPKKGRRGPKSG